MTRDVQQALDETAQLAERIFPALLNAGGLAAALRSAAEGAGIRASVDVPAGANYSPEVTERVYFCCIEAFEHVGGHPVTVTVREEDGALSFEVVEVVEDGARSIAPRPRGDAGLDGLRDRVEAMGRTAGDPVSARPGSPRPRLAPALAMMLGALCQVEDHGLDPFVDHLLAGEPELEEDRLDHLLDGPLGQEERLRDRRACSSPRPSRAARRARASTTG